MKTKLQILQAHLDILLASEGKYQPYEQAYRSNKLHLEICKEGLKMELDKKNLFEGRKCYYSNWYYGSETTISQVG